MADYRARTILGYLFDTKDIKSTQVTKVFDHEYTKEMGFKFCPVTGQSLWKESNVYIFDIPHEKLVIEDVIIKASRLKDYTDQTVIGIDIDMVNPFGCSDCYTKEMLQQGQDFISEILNQTDEKLIPLSTNFGIFTLCEKY